MKKESHSIIALAIRDFSDSIALGLCFLVLIFGASCERQSKISSRAATEPSHEGNPNQILPNERVMIHGSATVGGWPNGIVESVYGAHDSTAAGESGIGLMHLLIFPPSGGTAYRQIEGQVGNAATDIDQYTWLWWTSSPVVLKIDHFPEDHHIEILNKRYSLLNGNFFIINVVTNTNIVVQQLPLNNFDNMSPAAALKIFKRECQDANRVQNVTP